MLCVIRNLLVKIHFHSRLFEHICSNGTQNHIDKSSVKKSKKFQINARSETHTPQIFPVSLEVIYGLAKNRNNQMQIQIRIRLYFPNQRKRTVHYIIRITDCLIQVCNKTENTYLIANDNVIQNTMVFFDSVWSLIMLYQDCRICWPRAHARRSLKKLCYCCCSSWRQIMSKKCSKSNSKCS